MAVEVKKNNGKDIQYQVRGQRQQCNPQLAALRLTNMRARAMRTDLWPILLYKLNVLQAIRRVKRVKGKWF